MAIATHVCVRATLLSVLCTLLVFTNFIMSSQIWLSLLANFLILWILELFRMTIIWNDKYLLKFSRRILSRKVAEVNYWKPMAMSPQDFIEALIAIFCSHKSHHQLEDGCAEMNNHALPHIILGNTYYTLSVLLRNFFSFLNLRWSLCLKPKWNFLKELIVCSVCCLVWCVGRRDYSSQHDHLQVDDGTCVNKILQPILQWKSCGDMAISFQ